MKKKLLRSYNLVLLAIGFFITITYYVFQLRNENLFKYDAAAAKLLEKKIGQLEQRLRENRRFLERIKSELNEYSKIRFAHQSNLTQESLKCKLQMLDYDNAVDFNINRISDIIPFDNKDGGVWKQGWPIEVYKERFTEKDPLHVIVVPHSHNDPGWLKTFTQYYKLQTNAILNNMLNKLSSHEHMSFIWAEISFFSHWYESLKSEDAKETVKLLLENGQLEFVTGGWVMNDEANTHYFAIISQMVEGHEWLTHHLNYRPKYGWAIDPFGLSPTMAFLLKRMGLKGMVIQRVHYSMKKYLAENVALEFRWRQYWEKEQEDRDIMCHVMPFYSYDVPHTCGPDPKICCQFDFRRLGNRRMACPWKRQPKKITDANLKERSLVLLDQYQKKAMLFRKNVVLVPLGDDFRFDTESEWTNQFENYQKMFDYINSQKDLNTNVKFGTLSDYFKLALRDGVEEFPTLSGDFFTYSDREDNYWSGYYTSRPFYKRYDRILESHLRAAEILFSLHSIYNSGSNNLINQLTPMLTFARKNLALFQHHDGITGTAREFVIQDYAQRMFKSIKNCQIIMDAITSELFYLPMEFPSIPISSSNYYSWNTREEKISYKLDEQNIKWSIFFFNSLAHSRNTLVCIDVIANSKNWIIRDSRGKLVSEVQINKLWKDFDKMDPNLVEACFFAQLPPISITQYTIEISDFDPNYEQATVQMIHVPGQEGEDKSKDTISIKSDILSLKFSKNDGLLQSVEYLDGSGNIDLRIEFMKYGTRKGRNVDHSGAYLFIPDSDEPQDMKYEKPKIFVIQGSLMSRVQTLIESDINICQEIQLIRGSSHFELQNDFHLVKGKFDNKELVMRIYSGVRNEGEFYTDLNGFQMIKRTYREKIPLQGNVYPMPSHAYIQDTRWRLNVLSGQPLGVVSHFSGNLNVFLDRRLLQDDNRGLNQGLQDNRPTRTIFHILLEKASIDHAQPSFRSQRSLTNLLHPPFQMKSTKQSNQGVILFSRSELPCDVHLLNMRSNLFNAGNFYLFLHRFSTSCDSDCNGDGGFSLESVLNEKILTMVENRVDFWSLSLMHKQAEANLTDLQVQIDTNDIQVLGLQLKV